MNKPLPANALSSFVLDVKHSPRFERCYNKLGEKVWQMSCMFDVRVKLDLNLSVADRQRIEYRQYIRGGVWIARGNDDWQDASGVFDIPSYGGQSKCADLPQGSATGVGLSTSWKEDGKGSLKYGYRATANQWGEKEEDRWTYPDAATGVAYYLRDTPSLSGVWGAGDTAWVWFELYFMGAVVEVQPGPTGTEAIRVLKKKTWEFFLPNAKLDLWSNAKLVAYRGK